MKILEPDGHIESGQPLDVEAFTQDLSKYLKLLHEASNFRQQSPTLRKVLGRHGLGDWVDNFLEYPSGY